MATCSKCGLVAEGERDNIYPFFKWDKRTAKSYGGRQGRWSSWCRRCTSAAQKKLYATPHGRATDASAGYRRRYGVTLEFVIELWHQQKGQCAICKCTLTKPPHKHTHLDHCHNSEVVRALLCRDCNLMLGGAKDSVTTLEAAVTYLKYHQHH